MYPICVECMLKSAKITRNAFSVKNIPNVRRMLVYTYMQAFYTDWAYQDFWHFLIMYPICVECLHIGICKHSTQIGYKKLTPIPFLPRLGTFSKMYPICVESLRIVKIWKIRKIYFSLWQKMCCQPPQRIKLLCASILHKLGTFLKLQKCGKMYPICVECQILCTQSV